MVDDAVNGRHRSQGIFEDAVPPGLDLWATCSLYSEANDQCCFGIDALSSYRESQWLPYTVDPWSFTLIVVVFIVDPGGWLDATGLTLVNRSGVGARRLSVKGSDVKLVCRWFGSDLVRL